MDKVVTVLATVAVTVVMSLSGMWALGCGINLIILVGTLANEIGEED